MRKIVTRMRYEYDDGERFFDGYDLVDKPLVYDKDGDYLTYGRFWSYNLASMVAKFLSKKLK